MLVRAAVLIADITPGSASTGVNVGFVRGSGGRLFFAVSDGAHGLELWSSDGTPGGTMIMADINPGSDSTGFIANLMFATGGRLFFAANDGVHGLEMWCSDGTQAGTLMLADIINLDNIWMAQPGKCFCLDLEADALLRCGMDAVKNHLESY